ncbi:putative dehydrogenase [Hypnocyclicus thermotrophus]|uniref:Dehydrogenase n=1 Tax=Hypnocyclicus thermotrophus TaxID=1627895 RepID=A0AA46I656_9FUSO|nr:Gfo/Idh/MocA family oxidoreductase [Hypnocyclicus thermotrophus]TDT71968.1 putative dehydrogenase [Hypnocyclicus thermotrophus]
MNIGIVGSGKIVNTCLEAISNIKNIMCTAICVREKSYYKDFELSKKFNIKNIYTNYDEMLNDSNINFIYIGIINNLHYEYTKKALENNKNVICEKPFTNNDDELKNLTILAKSKKLFLFEAITTLYSPNFIYLKKNIDKIGPIKIIQCNYSQYSSRYDSYLNKIVLPAFNPELNGGALYDINVYNIHIINNLFGMPNSVQYNANLGFNGIDTSGVLTIIYDNFIAISIGAKDSSSPSFITIQGEKGYLKIDGPPNECKSIKGLIDNNLISYNYNEYENRMVYEFIAFYNIFITKDYNKCYNYLEHSINVMNILTTASKQINLFNK